MISSLLEFLKAGFLPKKRRCLNDRIKIVLELDSFDKGGLQKVVLDSALYLKQAISDVTIVTPGKLGLLAEMAEGKGIEVVGIDTTNPRSFNSFLISKNFDLAISHFSDFGYPFYKKNQISNITFIHNVYAFLRGQALNNFRKNDIFVDQYVSVSDNATRYARAKLGISPDKIHTIPNGLILDEHDMRKENAPQLSRSEFGLLDSDYVFLNVASYNLHKGHYLMADAMKRLITKRTDIKILCIGNVIFPPHVDGFLAYLREMGLEKYILLPGYFPNVESFYPIVDAFLLPSFIEGWSIAMNEAMYYEKPMILTDTGAAAQVIEGNDIGILVPNEYGDTVSLDSELLDRLAYETRNFKTSVDLSDAIESMANNREFWREAGKLGRQKILERYDFAKIQERYWDLYRALLLREGRI